MRHSFGPYILDEEARDLALRGVPVPIQPRVFDLLVHLVRNAGRVIPKDELMDALWPDVIVAAIMATLSISGGWTIIRQAMMELRSTRRSTAIAAE